MDSVKETEKLTLPEKLTLSEKKRIRIVETASGLFLDSGYGNVSMDEIARVSGVSKRTVYNHFSGKEELFGEIVRGLWNDFMIPKVAESASVQPREALIGFSHQMLVLLRSKKFTKMIRMILSEGERFPELHRMLGEKGVRTFISRLAEYISGLNSQGLISTSDPLLAAQQYLGMVKESLFWPVFLGSLPMPDEARDKDVIESSTDLFLRMYGK
jgi:TetR/AcrR family transcriptional regulator of autoinduction and epiphytic fitness